MSTPSASSPYVGLVPYSEQDAPYFFGREAETEIIEANLMASRLTLLYGASGVGKSSVLRAGVVPHLRALSHQNLVERGVPESTVVTFSGWRDDPLVGLVNAVGEAVKRAWEGRSFEPLAPSLDLMQALEAGAQAVGGELFIILDQFEEYFLYHAQEDGPGTFVAEFPRIVNRSDLRVAFLISIREDAVARLDRFKGRIPNLFDNYLRIEHLAREQARQAIVKPVEKYNESIAPTATPIPAAPERSRVTIEPALVDAVLDQVKTGQVIIGDTGRGVARAGLDERIETPYLQLVMTRLWDEERRARSSTLRLATLNRLGSAERIVRTHLDSAMNSLSSGDRDVAARIFRFLVTPSGSKIAHTVPDLASYAGLTPQRVTPCLDKLSGGNVRILRPVAPPPGQPNVARYEIFHDVLAPAILDWRERYLRARQRTRTLRIASVLGALVLIVLCGLLAYSSFTLTSFGTTVAVNATQVIAANQTSAVNATQAIVANRTSAANATQVSIRGTQVAGLSSALLSPEDTPTAQVILITVTPLSTNTPTPTRTPIATRTPTLGPGTIAPPVLTRTTPTRTATPTPTAAPSLPPPIVPSVTPAPSRTIVRVPVGLPGYIFGINDVGGAQPLLQAGKNGWIVVNVAINPPDSAGDYSGLTNSGLTVIVNLHNGYGSAGNLPNSAQYDTFAQQCAAFVAGSKGANIWIVGYEPNSAWERPGNVEGRGGETITPDMYAQAFIKCRTAIKRLPGHTSDWVIPAPIAPGAMAGYASNPNGDWAKYFQDMLQALTRQGTLPDAIALHAFTHDDTMDAGSITSDTKAGPSFDNRYYQFRSYRDFMGAVPSSLKHLPVFITEALPKESSWWQNKNTGWIQTAYAEINAWNSDSRNQPIQALALYRWESFDERQSISDKPALLDDLAAALTKDYRTRWSAPIQ